MQELAKLLATLCCGLFAGAAIYINLVEHPARVMCGAEIALTQFAPSYRRASVLQVTLAVLSCIGSITAWLSGASLSWLIGGIILISVIPFTLIVIFPVNKQLLASTLDKTSPKAQQLLSRWNALHAIRTILSCIALIIFLVSDFLSLYN